MAGRLIVRHRLDRALIQMEGVLHELLAIAGRAAASDRDAALAKRIDLFQMLHHDIQRTALIGRICLIEQFLRFSDQHQLGRRAAAVHAQIRFSRIRGDVAVADVAALMAADEFLIVFLVFEQRLAFLFPHRHVLQCLQLVVKLIIGKALARADGRAERHKVNGDIRAHRMVIIEVQRLFEALPQPFHEIERTAQKQDIALDAVSLRQ